MTVCFPPQFQINLPEFHFVYSYTHCLVSPYVILEFVSQSSSHHLWGIRFHCVLMFGGLAGAASASAILMKGGFDVGRWECMLSLFVSGLK